jgi:hypothetical protein
VPDLVISELGAVGTPGAATLDVVTDAEARRYVKLGAGDVTAKATILTALITAVSLKLDRVVGPVVRRTVTSEQHDGGSNRITLDLYPIYTFTTVTEYDNTTSITLTRETVGTAPASGYYAEPWRNDRTLYSGVLIRRSGASDYRFPCGRGNIVATYTAGRFADTASVDPRFKDAAGIMLTYLWQQYGQSVAKAGEYEVPFEKFPKFAVPNAVRDMLLDEWQLGPMVG